MTQIRKRALSLSLVIMLTMAAISHAQDAGTITIVGSAIVNSLVQELADASNTADIDVIATGTAVGIERFCSGDAHLATASRPMSADEAATCDENELIYSEFLVGHHIVAFIAHPGVPLECLSDSQLDDIFKPTASNSVDDWSFYDEASAELPLTLIVPPDNQIGYVIVDGLVVGDGLRRDVQTVESAADAISQASMTEGAIAFVPWSNDLISDEAITILEFSDDLSPDCTLPSAEYVESEQYSVALSMYVYVNRGELDTSAQLKNLMQYISDEANAAAIRQAGVTPPSAAAYNLNATVLADAEAVRVFSSGADEFEIPTDLRGTVTVAGAANAFTVLDAVERMLAAGRDELQVEFGFAGEAAGIE